MAQKVCQRNRCRNPKMAHFQLTKTCLHHSLFWVILGVTLYKASDLTVMDVSANNLTDSYTANDSHC